MPPPRILTAVLALSVLLTVGFWPDRGQSQDRTERISFPVGASGQTVTGTIRGYEGIAYLINVRAGQLMSVRFTTDNRFNYFNIVPPGRTEAAYNGSISGASADIVATRSGDYRIPVYLMRNAARRGEIADFRLRVSVTDGTATQLPGGGGDDGIDGGPDFWEVAHVPTGDRLNVRNRPSSNAAVVARLQNGTILRNRGCTMNGQTRWCRIERRNGRDNGWVAGRYLIESGG